jgi:D-alanyl-D-alanine carboxypeptidase
MVDALQRCLDDGIARGLPGVSAAIARGDEIVWSGVAGDGVDGAMRFGIGSITKPFVAVIILQLVAEGRLRLDQPIDALLGAAVDRIANSRTVTVAHLLGHRSGIPSWEFVPSWIREGRGADLDVGRLWGKADTLRYIHDLPATAPAGEAADYSNSNYTLLGLIIEAVAGNDLTHELRRRILGPLGLVDVHLEGFDPEPSAPGPRRYHWATDAYRDVAGLNAAFPEVRPGLVDVSASNLSVEWAAGGLVATASDLARFGAALRDGRLLDTAGMAAMQGWDATIHGREFGLGLYRERRSDGSWIGHDGGVLGYEATLFWIEGLDLTVAALANAGPMHSGPVPVRLYEITRSDRFVAALRALAAG